MSVYTFNAGGPTSLELPQQEDITGPRVGWSDGPPVDGYWKVGDRIFSTDPASPMSSWICTVEGSPGTWVSGGGAGGSGKLITTFIGRYSGVGNPTKYHGDIPIVTPDGLGAYAISIPGSVETDKFFLVPFTRSPFTLVPPDTFINGVEGDMTSWDGQYQTANVNVSRLSITGVLELDPTRGFWLQILKAV